MIETALVFALGALSAGILALILFPAFTRRAARLARRDVESRLPRSLDEIAAMRDGIRAEYAARTARAEAALEGARKALVDERLAKAEMSVELAALRAERRGHEEDVRASDERIAAVFADLRDREEKLAQALSDRRDLERRVADLERRLEDAERQAGEAERTAGEVRLALVAAEANVLALADPFSTRPASGGEAAAADGASPPQAAGEAAAPAVPPAFPLEIRPELAAAIAERLRVARRLASEGATVPPIAREPEPGAPGLPVAGAFTLPEAQPEPEPQPEPGSGDDAGRPEPGREEPAPASGDGRAATLPDAGLPPHLAAMLSGGAAPTPEAPAFELPFDLPAVPRPARRDSRPAPGLGIRRAQPQSRFPRERDDRPPPGDPVPPPPDLPDLTDLLRPAAPEPAAPSMTAGDPAPFDHLLPPGFQRRPVPTVLRAPPPIPPRAVAGAPGEERRPDGEATDPAGDPPPPDGASGGGSPGRNRRRKTPGKGSRPGKSARPGPPRRH